MQRAERPGRAFGLCTSVLASLFAFAGCGRVGYDPVPRSVKGADATDASAGSGANDSGPPVSTGGEGGRLTGSGGVAGATGGAASGGRENTGSASGAGESGAASGGTVGAGGRPETGGGGASGVAGAPIPDAGSDAPVTPPPCAVTAVADYCASVPSLPVVPVLDGVADCTIALKPIPELGWTGGAAPPDSHGEYALAWRPDGLYVFVHVKDGSLVPAEPTRSVWQGDALEIYVDDDGTYAAPPAYDNPGTRQLVIGGPGSAGSSSARGAQYASGHPEVEGDWVSSEFRAFGRADGYVIEAFVTAADLGLSSWVLSLGGTVGMNLSVDVSYPNDQGADAGGFGNRVGQYFLQLGQVNASSVLPPFDVRAFCNPSLVR